MKDLPPLQWLRSFEAAARHLSFTHAAAELSVTQSAISQQVKALENYLGHPMFIRKTRSLELTDAGFAYLPDIQSALTLLRKSTRAYFGEGHQRQSITIRSNFAFSTLWLSSRISEFIRLCPDVSIHIVPALWESDYRQKSEDIEIRFGTGGWTENTHILTGDLTCYPVCSPILAKSIVGDRKLANIPLISVSGMMEQWSDYFSAAGFEKFPLKYSLTTPSFNVALEMACHDLGMVLCHDLLCENLLEQGKLVKAFDLEITMEEKYYLVYDEEELSSVELQFCTWLFSQFQCKK